MKTNIHFWSYLAQFVLEMRDVSECGKVWYNQTGHKFNFTSPDVFHNYHKIYTFVPTHLQPFTKYLPATCFGSVGPSSGLTYEEVPLILVHFGIPNCYKDVIKILCAT
jgi:hypothetical protein